MTQSHMTTASEKKTQLAYNLGGMHEKRHTHRWRTRLRKISFKKERRIYATASLSYRKSKLACYGSPVSERSTTDEDKERHTRR